MIDWSEALGLAWDLLVITAVAVLVLGIGVWGTLVCLAAEWCV